MKHLFKPLLTALLLLCSSVINAHDFEVDGIYYNILSEEDKTVEVTFRGDSYNTFDEYIGAVVIPVSVKYNEADYGVTSIGNNAFRNCSSLTSIEIPNSITSIGSRAFYECSGLTSITIPNSVTSIGSRAFDGCSSLTSIIVDTSNTIYDSRQNCDAIIETASNALIIGCRNTIIPNSVTSIGSRAFAGCSSLTSIEIPNSVTSIGSSAFFSCSNLTSIAIPNSVTSIGDYAFYNCSNLKDVINFSNLIFSKGSENYGYISYYANKVINAPNGTIVNDFVFCTQNEMHILLSYIGNETEIKLPENYKGENYSIGSRAFAGCSSLTSIEIPNSVTSIGSSAFAGCSSLTSIAIPNSVTSIGSSAFRNCPGLTSIIVDTSNTIYDSRQNCNAIIETASNALIIGCRNTIIPKSVTSIGSGAFAGCSSLTSIEIPNSVTSIGTSAFSGCISLKDVINFSNLTFSKGSENYGYIAYYANKVINAPNGTIVNDFVFCTQNEMHILLSYIGNETEIKLPENYKGENYSIGSSAFEGCSSLTSIEIPNSVTNIGSSAFFGCSSLTSIAIPNSVTSIRSNTFDGCTSLTSIEIPNSVTSIGSSAFYDCI